jgi:hypothetical protein
LIKTVGFNEDSWVLHVETFSSTLGGFPQTMQEILGDVYFASKAGVISLAAAQEFGDFSASTITKKVQDTYATNIDRIVGSVVDRETTQYKLFFSNGNILAFTFNLMKQIKSTTRLQYDVNIAGVFSGPGNNGNTRTFFLGANGFCYEFDKGTSFNGNPVTTKLQTNYYHYRSPRLWTRFRRAQLDVQAQVGLTFRYRPVFTYGDDLLERGTPLSNINTIPAGSNWGEGTWGEFVWGGNAVSSFVFYMSGYGTVLSLFLATADKYRPPHIIQNLLTDYSVGSKRV